MAKSGLKKQVDGDGKGRVEVFESLLRCDLTGEETVERSREMARLMSEIANDEVGMKAVVQDLKSRISGKEARLDTLARNVQNGFEYRTVPCRRVFDFPAGEVYEVRCDTGEFISRRGLTPEERQQELGIEA